MFIFIVMKVIFQYSSGKSGKRKAVRREESQQTKRLQVCEKVEKSRRGSKSRLHLGRKEMKNCTPLWGEAHRSTCGSQDGTVNKPHVRTHFWKLRCRKSITRRSLAPQHISKSVSQTCGFRSSFQKRWQSCAFEEDLENKRDVQSDILGGQRLREQVS